MKLTTRITNGDIKNGKVVDPANCAIANRLKKAVKNVSRVSVLPDEIRVDVLKNNRVETYIGSTPNYASEFIRRFDHGLATSPFNLSLSLKRIKSRKQLTS